MSVVYDGTCPHCGKVNRAHDHPGHGLQPHHGAVSICATCLTPSVFVFGPFGLMLRKPTTSEMASIVTRPDFERVVEALNLERDEMRALWRLRREYRGDEE